MVDIALPMIIGNMEDIVAADQTQTSSDTSSTTQLYEREARLVLLSRYGYFV